MSRKTLWILGLIFVIGGCSVEAAPPAGADSQPGEKNAPAAKPSNPAREKVEAGAILLDVRTPGEFNSGHIEGAINIPVNDLESRISELPADKEVVVYCRSGARSSSAKRILESKGISQVYDLGSISRWR